MATGRQAFTGKTSGVIFDAILNRTPVPPTRVNPELPADLERIINKALEKDRDLRYQSAADLRVDLKRLKRDTDSGKSVVIQQTESVPQVTAAHSSIPAATPATRRPHPFAIGVFAVLLILAVGLGGLLLYRARTTSAPANAPGGNLTQISRWNKGMVSAKLSPDGHAVAFSSPNDGILQLFVMLTAGGDPLQLTRDAGDKFADSFSADGTEIYYHRSLGPNEEWAIATLGGAPRRAAAGFGVVPTSDGNALFLLKTETPAVFRVGKSGTGEEEVFRFDKNLAPLGVLPFPNNSDLLVTAFDRTEEHLYRVNLSSRSSTDLGVLGGFFDNGSPAWLDPGKSVLLSRSVNGLTNLWKYNLADRSFTQVTTGPGPDSSPMRDRTGTGIYYVSGKSSALLTAYQVKGGTGADVIADDVSQPIVSPDAKRVLYVRYPDPGHSELWVSDLDGANRLKLASGAFLVSLDWSPDGSQVSFSEAARLFVVGTDGRGLREIKGIDGTISWGTWSPDQTRLIVGTEPDETIWTANIGGSHVEKVLDPGFVAMALSPDNKYLLGSINSGTDVGIYQMAVADKRRVSLSPGVETFMLRFAPDYKSFIYDVAGRGEITFYRQGWRDGVLVGKPQVALRLPFAFPIFYKGNAFDFSRDLSKIVYVRPNGQHDLYFLSTP